MTREEIATVLAQYRADIDNDRETEAITGDQWLELTMAHSELSQRFAAELEFVDSRQAWLAAAEVGR